MEAKESIGNTAKMRLTVNPMAAAAIANLQTDYCAYIENLCFWKSVSYKIGESDSIANQEIGSLGPSYQQTLCPDYAVQYTLLNGRYIKHLFFTRTSIKHFPSRFQPPPQPQIIYRLKSGINCTQLDASIMTHSRQDQVLWPTYDVK